MSKLRWILVAVGVVLAVAVVGPWVYINFIEGDPPARLSLDDATTSTTASDGSQAGYRVKEVLFGQDAEAVGRTADVTGKITIDGTTVTDGSFTVDLTTVTSDQSRRDGQFHNRIMETSKFPKATFELTKPIDLGSVPAGGTEVKTSATGNLTVHGVTKPVTFDVVAKHDASSIAINGSIPVVFDDYSIPEPSFGPATVQDHGEIEFLLVLQPSS
jgi:polyisoprenoid-binding protein YceI